MRKIHPPYLVRPRGSSGPEPSPDGPKRATGGHSMGSRRVPFPARTPAINGGCSAGVSGGHVGHVLPIVPPTFPEHVPTDSAPAVAFRFSGEQRSRHASHGWKTPAARMAVKGGRSLPVHRSEAETLDGHRSGGYPATDAQRRASWSLSRSRATRTLCFFTSSTISSNALSVIGWPVATGRSR